MLGAELGLTFVFLIVILGATSKASSPGMAGLVIGWALERVWLFIVAPIAGAAVAGLVWKKLEE